MPSAANKGAVLHLLELCLQERLYRVVVEEDGSLRILALPEGDTVEGTAPTHPQRSPRPQPLPSA